MTDQVEKKDIELAEELANKFVGLLAGYVVTKATEMTVIKIEEALMWANSVMQDKNKKQVIQETTLKL
jgi:hypothetical protein